MAVFAIGDLHLSKDPSIDKPMDIFGPNWEDHDVRLEKNWKETISDNDTVILAGDLSWGLRLEEALADLNWIDSLPGKKVIIKGNHDLWWAGITKLNKMFNSLYFMQNHAYETDECIMTGSRGWIVPGSEGFSQADEKIYKRELLRFEFGLEEAKAINDKRIEEGMEPKPIVFVCHYPPTNDKFQPSEYTALFEKYGVKVCVYGHLHGKEVFKKGIKGNLNGTEYKLVSIDYLNCNPIRLY